MADVNLVIKAQISFVDYSRMLNWSVRYLIENNFGYNNKYTLFNIGDFLQRNRNTITIEDDTLYSRVTIKLYNKGVHKRNEAYGKEIGTKKQYLIKPGQFILSKIDARNGAFGIVPESLDGAVTTADFLSYDIDDNKINPYFLKLLTSTNQFLAYCQGASSGTTGRQRINEQSFLNAKIPLPSHEVQNKIAEAYNQKIQLAEKQEQQAKQLEQDIENYLFNVLKISPLVEEENNRQRLQFTHFKYLERWDVFVNQNSYISSKFENIKLQHITIGKPVYGANVKGIKKESNTRYIRITDINEDGNLNDEFVSPAKVEDKYLLQENDFLIARSGNTVGKTFLFKEYVGRAIFAGYLVKYGLNLDKIQPEYLLLFTKSMMFKKWIASHMRVAGQPNINGQEFLQAPIVVPPLKLQSDIADTIGKMKSKIRKLQQQARENRTLAIEAFEKAIFQ